MVTSEYTYQTINKKRGKAGIDDNGVLLNFDGVAMHDCWSSYWKYDGITHAICNAHLLRELTGIEELEPDHIWAYAFKELLLSMKKAKERAIARGKQELSKSMLRRFSKEYDLIMEVANEERPDRLIRPRRKKDERERERNGLLSSASSFSRMQCACLFMISRYHSITIRRNVMSFLSTGRKYEVSIFDALTAAVAGNAEIVLQ